MTTSPHWLKDFWSHGIGLLRPTRLQVVSDVTLPQPAAVASHRGNVIVPIRSLGPRHRERIATHLLALDGPDRYLRFGYAANDEQVARYVAKLDFERDDIFGIFNRRLDIIAMAHLAVAAHPEHAHCAEFGVSVLKTVRGRGYGARLFERAVMHARNEGASMVFIHALSENTAMLKIAHNAGARVQRDGSESEAFLYLPPANLDTRVKALLEHQWAELDYRLKRQARQFRDFLVGVQARRASAHAAGHNTPE